MTRATRELDYVRMTDTTWRILNATAGRRAELLDTLAPAERAVVAEGTSGPGFDMEQARRRKTVANVLTVSFPVTFFAYYGRTGAEGLHTFLDSGFWQRRPAQPGSVFPPAATASAAFAGFLRACDWIARQEDWVGEAFAFEEAYLFGGTRTGTGPDAGPAPYPAGRPRPVAGAWVAEATFDVPAYGRLLRERGAVDPWTEALLLVKRRPEPLAVISVPAGERLRRVRLTGDTVAALRWLWDTGVPVPEGVTGTPAYARAARAGLLDPTGSAGSAGSADAAEWADPAGSAESADPAGSAGPAGPAHPAESAGPAGPAGPADSAGPVETAGPGGLAGPVETVGSAGPAGGAAG